MEKDDSRAFISSLSAVVGTNVEVSATVKMKRE